KPKTQRFELKQIENLPDPADRQALAVLVGAREQSPYNYGYGYSSYYASAPCRYHLTAATQEALLPLGCGTGRCFLRPGEGADLRPLRWDGGAPWEFWLKVAPDGRDKNYVITGELRRDEERMALAAPVLLVAGGLVFWDGRAARLDDSGAFDWITLLRREG